jgi:polysaccharide deacetylase 2 family uncharacterized protein YibQ
MISSNLNFYKVFTLIMGLCSPLVVANNASANISQHSNSSLKNQSLTPSSIKIAIVIDDIGYRYTDKQALLLPGQVTYSILPQTPYGKRLALQAFEQQKDVILHIPMESENRTDLGPGALTKNMSQVAINSSLEKSFNEIPFAIGINNHMGSYLTQSVTHMAWTMGFLKSNNLFFLDSRTSPQSKAGVIAKQLGVPVRERHVFLDNQLSSDYISKQFQTLISTAQKNRSAIAIAHPHPESMKALQLLIPTLKNYNIELVPLSALYDSPVIKRKIAKKEVVEAVIFEEKEEKDTTKLALKKVEVFIPSTSALTIEVKAPTLPTFSAPSIED